MRWQDALERKVGYCECLRLCCDVGRVLELVSPSSSERSLQVEPGSDESAAVRSVLPVKLW